MKHKIITTDNYLLVVDDSEIKENNYVYVEGHVKPQMCKGFENNGDVLCYNNLPYIKEKTKKVISHLPLNNSPILEGVDLLPPLEDEVEIAEKALFTFLDKYFNTKRNWRLVQGQDTHTDKEAIMMLYSDIIKAKEKYKYTEEDTLDAWELGASEGLPLTREKKNNLIKHLQQQKMPVGFECEINNPMFALSLQPQITTNPQGLTQWVGEYIY
jgi:hypothetical protein